MVPRDKCAPSQRKPLTQVFLTFRAQLNLVFSSGSTVDVVPVLDENGLNFSDFVKMCWVFYGFVLTLAVLDDRIGNVGFVEFVI